MTGLRAATRNTLMAHGPAMLAHPQRFVAVVTDFIDVESPEALVLYESCDEQFFAEFANAFEVARSIFNAQASALVDRTSTVSRQLDNALSFLDRCYGDGQEMLIFASHLAVDPIFMRFVSTYGSDSFVEHSQALMFHERGLDLLREVDGLQGL